MVKLIHRDPFEDLLRGFLVRPVGLDTPFQEGPDMRVEVSEQHDAYQLLAELPGIRKEDIQVSIDGNSLQISAERKQERSLGDGERVLRSEFAFGKLSRSFQFAQEIDDTQSEARFADGVLTLKLPKKASAQARRLTIQ